MNRLTLKFESEATADLFRRLAEAVPGVTVEESGKTSGDDACGSEPRFASESDMDEALGIGWKKN